MNKYNLRLFFRSIKGKWYRFKYGLNGVPEYSIWGGNPARPIRMRFNEQEINLHKKMLQSKDIKVNFTQKKK